MPSEDYADRDEPERSLDAFPEDFASSLKANSELVQWYAQLPLVERKRFSALLAAVIAVRKNRFDARTGVAAKATIGGVEVHVKIAASVTVKLTKFDSKPWWNFFKKRG
jgi:hypothetical protein